MVHATFWVYSISSISGMLCDFFICTLEQIIVWNKYCTYNKPIPKISCDKTLQNLCKMRLQKNNKKVRNKMFTFNILFFKRRSNHSEACLISFMIRKCISVKKSACVGKKILIEGGLHQRSHNIPLSRCLVCLFLFIRPKIASYHNGSISNQPLH